MSWKLAGSLVGVLAALLLWLRWRVKKNQAKWYADLQALFGQQGGTVPAVTLGSAMGWTTYTVTFASKDAWEAAVAAGLTDDFLRYIRRYHGPDFEAKRAVTFRYEGRQADLNAALAAPRAQP